MHGTTLNTLRILIVEDHDFQRSMLERMLRTLGVATVHSVPDGARALRVVKDPATPVDIVLTDLMMPGLDGIELIAELKTNAGHIPIILASADETTLHAALDIAEGNGLTVLGAIAKPITPDNLRPVLERYAAKN